MFPYCLIFIITYPTPLKNFSVHSLVDGRFNPTLHPCYTIPQPNSTHASDPIPVTHVLGPPLPSPAAKTAGEMVLQTKNFIQKTL